MTLDTASLQSLLAKNDLTMVFRKVLVPPAVGTGSGILKLPASLAGSSVFGSTLQGCKSCISRH